VTFIDDWRRVLRRSASVLLAYLSTLLYGLGGALFVYADELGDGLYFWLYFACFALAGLCTAVIPFARIIKQKGVRK